MSSKRNWTINDFVIKIVDSDTKIPKFSCGEHDDLGLNDFLLNDAKMFYRSGMGVTHLFYLRGTRKLVGYVTLAMGSIFKVKNVEKSVKGSDVKPVDPALLLGRLAVAEKMQGQGLGTFFIKYCVGIAVFLSKSSVGCRFVTLATKKGYRVDFYVKRRFKPIKSRLGDDYQMMCLKLPPNV